MGGVPLLTGSELLSFGRVCCRFEVSQTKAFTNTSVDGYGGGISGVSFSLF
jgi:hypothetical protein